MLWFVWFISIEETISRSLPLHNFTSRRAVSLLYALLCIFFLDSIGNWATADGWCLHLCPLLKTSTRSPDWKTNLTKYATESVVLEDIFITRRRDHGPGVLIGRLACLKKGLLRKFRYIIKKMDFFPHNIFIWCLEVTILNLLASNKKVLKKKSTFFTMYLRLPHRNDAKIATSGHFGLWFSQ